MNNLSKLYKPENKVLLETISLLNFAIGFDKSIASFNESDLFGFLERVQNYDFKNYDDLFYILDMFEDSFWHISQCISSQIRRTHVVMPISRAKELDSKSIGWIARQNGITIQQKLAQGKVLGVKRYGFRDNPENRVLKIVLMRLVAIAEFREFDEVLRNKIVQFIRNNLNEVNHKAQITPNNILLHHKHYAKFYKIYKWLNHLEYVMSDFQSFKRNVNITRENLKKFIALSLLHKNTNVRILPSDLSYSQKDYSVHFETKWLLDCDIEKYLNSENDLKSFKNKCLNFIETNNALKHIVPPPDKINSSKSKIFIDIFRLYPMLYVNSKHIAMPLLLKQKINNKIINANHTKIIDMNNPFYTLAESLLLKNSEVFNVFLHDIKEFVGESNILYYILPDYINVFDFNDKHRSIRAYFNQAFFINKSILAAAKMLFNGELKEKDTLLYFQKNNMEEIYVTPILVRYKDELKESKSKGLYLEKYPSKQYKNNIKNKDEIVQKLLKKCLQNGVKALVQNDIKYYKNNRIYDISKLPKEEVNNDIHEVKLLYKNSHDLFKSDIKIIQDDPKENLEYYKELIEQKENGFILWGEKLPKLDMGVSDGIKEEKFNLVNDNDELDFKNEICIKDQFIIPANAEKIIAPLFLEDKNINYSMVLESDMMPFKEEVRCRLTLQYSYDDENIYTLIFRPLDGNLQQMQAKWHKGVMKQIRKDMSNIYPPYPLVKSIYELQHYPKKDGDGENDLFNWIETSIEKIQKEFMQKEKVRATVYHINKNKYFCFAKDDLGNEIFCHKDKFINKVDWNNINEGDIIFLIRYETDNNKYRGESISLEHLSLKTDEIAAKILYNTRFPMISIFNGHSLRDSDMPSSFCDAIRNFIDFIKDKLKDMNNKELKDELVFFCSILHDCSPIGGYLLDYNIKNHRALAYAIGDATLPWQKEILDSVINDKFEKQISILAISLWRSKDLVFEINSSMAYKLIKKSIEYISFKNLLYKSKNSKVLSVKPFLVNTLEVLLSLLRLREKGFNILNPSDKNTRCLIQKLLELNQLIEDRQVNLKSYLKLELEEKPSKYKEMPDLIYALLSFINGENTNSIKIAGVNDEA